MFLPLLSAGLLSICVLGSDGVELPREHHPWGRFRPGSWIELRETTWDRGAAPTDKSAKVVVTRTVLKEWAPRGITLQTTSENPPAKSEAATQTIDWDDLPVGLPRKVRLSVGEFKVAGISYTCQTHEIVALSNGNRWTTKLWYAPDRVPYLLKSIQRFDGMPLATRAMEVTGFDVEQTVKGNKQPCVAIQVSFQNERFLVKETQWHSPRVPGGLVHATKEIRDKIEEKNLLGKMELVDFHVAP